MSWMLNINVPKPEFSLTHGEKVVLLGSCFSDNLAAYFNNSGFEANSNPFGTIYHPLALANIVRDALDENHAIQAVNNDDLWFDWRASGTVFSNSEAGLTRLIASTFDRLKTDLTSAHLLVVTFGTAWEYRLANGKVVGNCHKQATSSFEKSLTSSETLFEVWSEIVARLKAVNPKLNIVFTVSPVRHIRDGLVENNRSKARLLELVHSLDECNYFPSYELVIDLLRDYRFYKADLIHPNNQAIEVVWKHLSAYLFDEKTLQLNQQIEQIHAMEQHHPLYPGSNSHLKFEAQLQKTKADLLASNAAIYWNSPQKKV